MIGKSKTYYLLAGLMFSACSKGGTQDKASEYHQTASYKPFGFSLARLDSAQSFLDSLRALPKADSTSIRAFYATADSAFIPNKVTDTVTTYHRYASLQIDKGSAEVMAIITEFNTVTASLQLMLFDKDGRCTSTVPLAFHYDEAGGKEEWSSVQTTPTTFLQRKELSDFVYDSMKASEEGQNPIGRSTALIQSIIELKNMRLNTRQTDSTYTVTKY